MDLQDYIIQCQETLYKLENIEEYEYCQELHDLVNSIKNRDSKTYIELTFDIKGLYTSGFFKEMPTIKEAEKKLVKFFSLNSIFEYSLIGGGMFCSFKRTIDSLTLPLYNK